MKNELLKLMKDNPELNSTEIVYLYFGGFNAAMRSGKYHEAQQIMNELKAEVN